MFIFPPFSELRFYVCCHHCLLLVNPLFLLLREDKTLYEGLLTRYSETLKKFKIFQYVGSTNTLTIPVLPQLRSLGFYSVNRSEALALLHASKDTLVDLVITGVKIQDPSELKDFKLPNLKNLDLSTVDSGVALSLMKPNFQTITKLSLCKVKLFGDEIGNIMMPNLSSLQE